MRNCCLVVLILSLSVPAIAQNPGGLNYRMTFPPNRQEDIRDGVYDALVKYTNYSTGYWAKYTLQVEVKYGKVKAIYFNNNGSSVHDGYNGHDYLYQGGRLNFEYNQLGQIIRATTKVTIYKGDSIYEYKVTIE